MEGRIGRHDDVLRPGDHRIAGGADPVRVSVHIIHGEGHMADSPLAPDAFAV